MSYRKAEEILPRELIEAIQQYVDGESIYIPSKEKQDWGAKSDAKRFFRERNESIYEGALRGMRPLELALRYSLSEKSIQRILREQKVIRSQCVGQI